MSWEWAVKAPDWRSIWRKERRSARAPDDLSRYAQHPILFIFRYLRQRAVSHTPSFSPRSWSRFAARSPRSTASSSWSIRCARPQAGGIWLAFAFLVVLIASRQLEAVARRQLDRERRLHGGHRRPAARPVSPSHRALAELLCRSSARHADEPHHRHVQCGVSDREHVRVERAAALRRDGRGDQLRRAGEPADGGCPCLRSAASWCA